MGPVLSGSDPGGANGSPETAVVKINSTLTPSSTTTTSATYTVPPGAITVTLASNQTYTNTVPTTVQYTYPATGDDEMIITVSLQLGLIPVTIVETASLANGSFPRSVKEHPARFSPARQTLTPASTASGPGSKFMYTVAGESTTLGFSGSASN
jgi:hypothetical protein